MGRGDIKTHIRVVDNSVDVDDLGFELSAIKPRSANFYVRNVPVSLLAWGLTGEDRVLVKRARVASLGVARWRGDGSCCNQALPPDDNGNVAHMPYVRCGVEVVLTADKPHCLVDDVGTFFLEYVGENDVLIEKMDDAIVRKGC